MPRKFAQQLEVQTEAPKTGHDFEVTNIRINLPLPMSGAEQDPPMSIVALYALGDIPPGADGLVSDQSEQLPPHKLSQAAMAEVVTPELYAAIKAAVYRAAEIDGVIPEGGTTV